MMVPPSLPAEQPSFRRTFSILLVGIVAIGCSPIFVRLSELPPTATAFHRVFLAMPVLWLWMALGKRRGWALTQPATRRDYGLLLLAGLVFAGDLVFWHWSLNLSSVANAVLLANFTPIFVTAASFLLWGERFSPVFLLGVGLAVGGAAILMGDSLSIGSDHVLGDSLGLVTAIFYTAYILLVGRLRRRFASATILAWTSLPTIIVLLVVTLVMGEPLVAMTLTGWLILLGLALISHAVGQGLIAHAMAHLPVAFTSVSLLLQPAVAIILAWFLLNESLSPWQAAGVTVTVIASGIVAARLGSRGPGAHWQDFASRR
jgi:drug/metabolite transporter (DMT)-like permease